MTLLPSAQDSTRNASHNFPGTQAYVAMKRGKRKAMAEGALKEASEAFEKAKPQVRALVEHPLRILNKLFIHRKTRYRGLSKNTAQLHSPFALENLVIAKRELWAQARG